MSAEKNLLLSTGLVVCKYGSERAIYRIILSGHDLRPIVALLQGGFGMDCKQAAGLISEYIDGVLEGRFRRQVDAHLRVCPECRRELELLRSVVACAGDVETVNPPSNLKARIMGSVAGCQEVRGLLPGYVDGELAPSEVGTVEQHAAVCRQCANEIDSLRILVRESGLLPVVEPPSGLRERIAAATTDRRTALGWLTELLGARSRQWAFGAAAAALVVSAFVSRAPQIPVTGQGASSYGHSRTARVTVTPQTPRPSVGRAAPVVVASRRPDVPQVEAESIDTAQTTAMPAELPSVPEIERPEPAPIVVAKLPEPQPAVEPESAKPDPASSSPVVKKEAPKMERDPLVKIAVVPPAVSSDNGEWIRQMKTSPVMQIDDSGKTGVRTTDPRF
jgi:anti-sigma factor RsiW